MSDRQKHPGRTPSRGEMLRPAEFVGIAFVLALFTGLVALLATREIELAGILFGIAFIVTLVVLAMFALTFRQNDAEKRDLAEQDEQAALKKSQQSVRNAPKSSDRKTDEPGKTQPNPGEQKKPDGTGGV